MDNQNENEKALKESLIRSIFRFRKVGLPSACDGVGLEELNISPSELICLKSFAANRLESEEIVCGADMQELLYVTKPAISRMLHVLEKKGYVEREINRSNRRKLTVTLTDKGTEVLARAEKKVDDALNEIIHRFGEEETRQFIEIFNRFADIADDVSGKLQESFTTEPPTKQEMKAQLKEQLKELLKERIKNMR
ncbi:MAG: MarR family transcriptional regulator [Clostridiaceae bacterium]|jgi:DNA-binding MarR family transcriptional regulator|nr:MarR family transcriptional regulator [Clostridiaceae bacterium]